MQDTPSVLALAINLIASGNSDLFEIIGLSLRISFFAVLLSCLLGLPLGALLSVSKFRGHSVCVVLINSLMGMPPVVVGLFVYLALSRAGPLGWLNLLYTPSAMVIAQTLLITPIVAALSRQILADYYQEYKDQFRSLRLTNAQSTKALLWDARFSLVTVALAGFGRSIAEVGAVIIVGGNIEHLTRVMTTAIALETSKGDLPMALALGVILLVLALSINGLASVLNSAVKRYAHG